MDNKVSKESIEDIMDNSEWSYETKYNKVTVVNCKLPNGFILTEASGAVCEENYDEQMGIDICKSKIEDQLWKLEGYALAKKLYENSLQDK